MTDLIDSPADLAAHHEDRELPYGGTIRDVRLQIARLAAEAEHVFNETIVNPHWTDDQRRLNLMAHGCSLHGWALACLLRWVEERFGAEAADQAAAMVQDMAVNGGADLCDDLTEIGEPR